MHDIERATFTLDDNLAERARRLGINISAAARDGVVDPARAAFADTDRTAHERHPEPADQARDGAEVWGAP